MNYRIYFDMDGVLADFVGGSLAVHGKSIPRMQTAWNFFEQVGLTASEFWTPLRNPDFWADLDPHEDGFELWRRLCTRIDVERIGFLTSPGCPGSVDGKRRWLEKHFPEGWHKRAAYCEQKELCAAPCKLLIDDYEKNVDAFTAHGGRAVLVPRPWNRRRGECDAGGNFDVDAIYREILTV